MGDVLNIAQLKSLEGGVIRMVLEEGAYTSPLLRIEVVNVPADEDRPAHQILELYHDGFYAEGSSGIKIAEPNPIRIRNVNLDWRWLEGKFIALEDVTAFFTLIPPTETH